MAILYQLCSKYISLEQRRRTEQNSAMEKSVNVKATVIACHPAECEASLYNH